jgi:CRISPR-associated protein Cmr6
MMFPSPWLKNLQSQPSQKARFVEYLRWMRSPSQDKDSTVDSGTILELFQAFEDNDWSEDLKRLTKRTIKLADMNFRVKCPWRIRVGGHKGPESMLLPAFDALGIPYIPSSTLRGIARATAMQDPTTTKQQVKKIFGDLDPDPSMGKVIFLDAYPLPGKNNQGGLTVDMTNALWEWKGNNPPEYGKPNPNIFLSLKKPTFIIGLRRTKDCPEDVEENDILYKVRNWLLRGLIEGIGSRVNSGYGELCPSGKIHKEVKAKQIITRKAPILKIEFELEGQLIHGGQRFNRDKGWERNTTNRGWKSPGESIAEVRSTAFRCMLRYWFRTLALGVLSSSQVKMLEMEIFGGLELNPQTNNPYTGLFRLEVRETQTEDPPKNSPDYLSGRLTLRHNFQVHYLSQEQQKILKSLLRNLTWLMFHLGGVGQGARRPCYQRQGNPPWRGSTLVPLPTETDRFWHLPHTITKFQVLFQKRIKSFYKALKSWSSIPINFKTVDVLKTVNTQTRNWAEAVDKNCQIFVCCGNSKGKKNYALSILHHQDFKIKKTRKKREQKEVYWDYDPELCGDTSNPSPVWIRQVDYVENIDYQVVTVFGSTSGIRQDFIEKLTNQEFYNNDSICLPIFPIE